LKLKSDAFSTLANFIAYGSAHSHKGYRNRLVLKTLLILTLSVVSTNLYGLKQAPRAWYSRFATYLVSLGFVEAKSDTSLFVYQRGSDTAYLLLYIDDIILTASSPGLLRRIILALQREFSMKDLGELHHFLGMHV